MSFVMATYLRTENFYLENFKTFLNRGIIHSIEKTYHKYILEVLNHQIKHILEKKIHKLAYKQ